jgi:hypothetical protein
MQRKDGEQCRMRLLPEAGDDGQDERNGREVEDEKIDRALVVEAPAKRRQR